MSESVNSTFFVGYRTLDEFQLDAVSFDSDTLDDGKGTLTLTSHFEKQLT